MMKKSFLFVIFLLIALSCYSQETYPKKILNNTDTIVGIEVNQAKKINEVFEEKRYLSSLVDSLKSKCSTLEKKIDNDSAIVNEKDSTISDLNKIISNKDDSLKKSSEELEVTKASWKKSKKISEVKGWILLGSLVLNSIFVLSLFY